MKNIITFLFLLNNLAFFSQQWAWAKEIGAFADMGQAAIQANASGDLFIVSNITFQTSHTSLSRVNPTGQVTWSTSIDGWNTALIDVSVDNNNNSYVLGWFAQNLVFPDTTIWEGNGWELFIAAYAPNGHRKWVKTFTDAANWGNFITNDNNGNLIFAFSKSWKLFKYDQNGNLIWQNNLSCDYPINSLTIDHNNNIYLTGIFSNTLVINGSTYYSDPSTGYAYYGFICKISTLGTLKNVQTVRAFFNDLGVDSLNNYYAVGTFVDSLKIGQTVLTHTCASQYADCSYNFIARFDSSSNCSWIKEHNSSFDQIEVTNAGDCYVSGRLTDTLSFNPISVSNSSPAVYIFKVNSTGAGQWAVKDNSNTGSASINDMTRSENGHVFISGMYSGQSSFGSSTLPSEQYSYYAAALNENSTITSLGNTNKGMNNVQLFPNPSKGSINLKRHPDIFISGVYDALGNKVNKTISPDGSEINLEDNGKGIYFIELSNNDRREYRKVIIE